MYIIFICTNVKIVSLKLEKICNFIDLIKLSPETSALLSMDPTKKGYIHEWFIPGDYTELYTDWSILKCQLSE